MAYKCQNFCNGQVLDAESLNCIERGIVELEEKISDLLYKAISITSYSAKDAATGSSTLELGSKVTDVIFAWTFNKTPTALAFNGEKMSVDATGTTLSGLSITANKTWALVATDERDANAENSAGISFLNGVYYGVVENGTALDSAAILGLTRNLQGSKALTFTADAGASQRIAYAAPTRYGTPVFNIGGFDYEWEKTTVEFTNDSGYTESYDVWVSPQTGLGSTTVKVS